MTIFSCSFSNKEQAKLNTMTEKFKIEIKMVKKEIIEKE